MITGRLREKAPGDWCFYLLLDGHFICVKVIATSVGKVFYHCLVYYILCCTEFTPEPAKVEDKIANHLNSELRPGYWRFSAV